MLGKKLIWGLIYLLLIISCKEKQVISQAKSSKPNIIIILADDQGYGDIGYHGNPWIKTPHLDSYANESLELTNFHVGTTCAPTRAGLMTGRNANRNNAWHTIAGCSILLEDEETMPEVFAKNGYETAMFGKWHLGDNFPYRPQDRGFKDAYYLRGGGVQQTPDFWNNNYFNDTYFRNGIAEKSNGYCTDVFFNEATNYIDKTKRKPFLLYLPLNAAHEPFNVPKKYTDLYTSAPLSDNQKRFYGMITNIDENFGKLIEHLKQNNLYDNTIIIFSTDNGTAKGLDSGKIENGEKITLGYNAGLRGTKGSHYDGGHLVPFFMSWPKGNILQKQKLNELIAHVDLLPTLAKLAGISYSPKKHLDGTSVSDILNGNKKSLDRMLVIDTQRNQLPVKGKNSCVMSTNWRLIDGKELYNTAEDPGEKKNVASEHPELVKKMQTFYNEWWASIEPDVRYAYIPIGFYKDEPVLITVHDIHTEDRVPWNQELIRQGDFRPKGYYSIEVVEDGVYEFQLSRYPPEANLAINTNVDKIEGTPSINELPEGIGFNINKALVQMGDTTIEVTADPNKSSIAFQGKLTKGKYNMQSKFITPNGEEIPAYYTLIKQIN